MLLTPFFTRHTNLGLKEGYMLYIVGKDFLPGITLALQDQQTGCRHSIFHLFGELLCKVGYGRIMSCYEQAGMPVFLIADYLQHRVLIFMVNILFNLDILYRVAQLGGHGFSSLVSPVSMAGYNHVRTQAMLKHHVADRLCFFSTEVVQITG